MLQTDIILLLPNLVLHLDGPVRRREPSGTARSASPLTSSQPQVLHALQATSLSNGSTFLNPSKALPSQAWTTLSLPLVLLPIPLLATAKVPF